MDVSKPSEANRGVDNVGTCEEPMPRWNSLRFAGLLALADAASAASGNGEAQGNDGVATSSFVSDKCQNENNGGDYLSASLFWNRDPSLDSELGANGNSMPEQPYYVPAPQQQSHDINLPRGTMSGVNSSMIITQLVPITPEKDVRVQNKPVSEVQDLYANERTDEEREKLENEVVAARVDTNEVQRNKELSKPVIDSSFAAVSTPFKENHNPDKGGSHGTDLNEAPQKKPKRKRHRPKVVTEGKPKRTPKSVTPEAAGSKENPTVKRKYVRMKRINISSAAPPVELTEEFTGLTATPLAELTGECTDLETLELARKSCRRGTKFEIGQTQDESSAASKENLGIKRKYVRRKGINKPAATPRVELAGESCKSSINLDSELQAQDISRKGVQSRSTVQLGEGIALVVEHTEAGIAYDISCSVNQMLKEYMSLPERQVPSTPLLTKTNPPQPELNAVSQKDSTTEGEVQLIAHNGQINIAKTNNQISLRSPKGSNYSTNAILTEGDKATLSKRRYSHAAEQSDASIPNLVEAYFSTLDAYQMINRIHFPNINKKKRTEKGQNSTTCSSSSCITATKNVERTATCLQHDAETIPCSLKASRQASGPPPLDDSTVSLTVENKERGLQNYRQSFEHILALIQKDRSTRKGSRGPTQVRDLTSLTQLVPITPEKGVRVQNKPVSEVQNLYANERTDEEREKLENEVVAARIDTNEVQRNKELSKPVIDSSFAAVSTPFKENHNPDKGGSHGTGLNETPQQKPKWKKNWPKVVTEGKPKRTPKPVTPEATGSKENLTVKRKYVRMKSINISSAAPPAELTEESTDLTTVKRKYVRMKSINISSATIPAELTEESTDLTVTPPAEFTGGCTDLKTLEPARKSSRRATKFEIGQSQDESSIVSKENLGVKRKYVRRKGINKPAAIPRAELTGESSDLKTFEPARKSCRRTSNFDIEQLQDESSTCKSSINLDSELQAQDFSRKGVQSRSTVQLGEGIAVEVKHPEAGIAYDIACSMNQMLKEYISLPERQVTTTPLLTKTNPPRAELNADSQKDSTTEGEVQLIAHNGQENIAKTNNQISLRSPNDSNYSTSAILTEGDKATRSKRRYSHAAEQSDSQKDSTTEGEVQLIAHNGQENIAKTNNQISLRSPNDSNYSTSAILTEGDKATRSKRRYSHAAEQSDASIRNLVDAYFSTLDAYQMINRIHFPNINKKKRTEKGQNSTAYSSSSCITATKYVERTATCLQHDAETIPCSLKASRQVSGPPPLDDRTVSLTVENEKTVSLTVENEKRGLQNYRQSFEHILALIQKDRSTRKGSRGPTRVRDLTSPTRILECITHPTKQPLVVDDGQTDENPHKSHTYIDDLVAKMRATLAIKKRTKKRNSLVT